MKCTALNVPVWLLENINVHFSWVCSYEYYVHEYANLVDTAK